MSFTPLATVAPPDITDATDTTGTGTEAARKDHTHAHGARAGGTLHANAVAGAPGTAGFMKGIQANAALITQGNETTAYPNARALTDTATVTWDFSTPGQAKATAAGGGPAPAPATTVTDVLGTGPSVVGTGTLYARDDHAHFHGDLPGGELHDLVNEGESGLPGFMSVADKSKLDGITPDATASFPSNVAATEITDATAAAGVGDDFSRFDHVHPHGLRGAGTDASPLHTLATNSAPGFMAAADHSALALWDVTKCRYFFIDNEAGDDTHAGFLDRSPGHDFGGGEAAAVAAAKIKTVERLLQILPRNGNGRMAKLLFKNRAAGTCYLMADGVTLADLDLTGIHGYRWIGRCGSTDFENGSNDLTNVGAIIAVDGPNGDFSFTNAFATTGTLNAAAGSFGTDANVAGLRVRFKGNVTGGLANVCWPIYRVTSTTELVPSYIFSPVPAIGDDFWIERIGVTFNNVYDIGSATTMTASDATTEMVSPMVGIQAQADTGGGQFRMGVLGKTQYAFCSSRNAGGGAVPRAFSNPDAGHIVLADVYRDEIGQEWPVGPCKIDSTMELQAATLEVPQGGLFCATDSTSRTVALKAAALTVGHGTQFKQGLFVELAGAGPNRFGDGNLTQPIRMGATTTLGAALFVRAGSAALICNGVTFDSTEASSNYGMIFTGGPRAGINAESLGSGPNVGLAHINDDGGGGLTMKGIKIVDCWQGRFTLQETAIGFGGAGSGLELPGVSATTCTAPFATFGLNNLVDINGNDVQGSSGRQNTGFIYVHALGTSLPQGSLVALQGTGDVVDGYLQASDFVANSFAGIALWDIADDARGYCATHGTPFTPDLAATPSGNLAYASCDVAGGITDTSPTVGVGRYKYRIGIAWAPSNILLRIDNAGVLADGDP